MRKQSTAILLSWLAALWLAFPAAFAADPEDILPADEAFRFAARVQNANVIALSWDIADGYYLYRSKFGFASLTPGVETGDPEFPGGQVKQDKFFGTVEIYRNSLQVQLPIRRQDPALSKFEVEVAFQGCADAGVCYMPIRKTVAFDLQDESLSAADGAGPPGQRPPFVAVQDRIAATLNDGSIAWIMLSFLGFGLLLGFTPCVFPMVPIISGIVVGHGPGLTTRRAFALSLSYVFAAASTYTIFGVLAGLFGNDLQIIFQQPWAIAMLSGIFILLAFSLFGAFSLQIPTYLQSRISILSAKQKGGSLLGAAIMGLLSALIVGPCVTAPLAGILIYIGQSGNAVMGGLALFVLGLGMGMPLLVIGASAGKLLPKAGAWMRVINNVFGLGLLAVAVWLLQRIITPDAATLLWGLLLIAPAIYLALARYWKSVVVFFLLGTMYISMAPIEYQPGFMRLFCIAAEACEKPPSLAFQYINNLDELQLKLHEAHEKKRWVMLDFYADWCATCQELKHNTFSDPKVQAALSDVLLVQADVTQNLPAHRALLKQYRLPGPPAILFFGPDLRERKPYRVIGYLNADKFLDIVKQMFPQPLD